MQHLANPAMRTNTRSDELCLYCLAVASGHSNSVAEQIKEFAYVSREILLAIFQYVGFAMLGVMLLVCAIFTGLMHSTSADTDKRQQHKDEERQAAEYEAALHRQDKDREEANSLGRKHVTANTQRQHEDDDRVLELKDLHNKVRSGQIDPEHSLKAASELIFHRVEIDKKETQVRDTLRTLRQRQAQAAQLFAAAKDELARADNLSREAEWLRGKGSWEEAEHLYRQADDAYCRADKLSTESFQIGTQCDLLNKAYLELLR